MARCKGCLCARQAGSRHCWEPSATRAMDIVCASRLQLLPCQKVPLQFRTCYETIQAYALYMLCGEESTATGSALCTTLAQWQDYLMQR